MNYATQLDRALTRQEAMETRDADAEAKRELWEIARKKEQARRQALLRQVQDGEIPIIGPAACTQMSGDRAARVRVFFSQDRKVIDQAKAICAGCPRREPCLEGALERREPWGVWGGELFRNGHVVINRKRRPRHQRVRAESISPANTCPGRIRTQNCTLDFDRDYPSRQMPVIAGETRGNGRMIT